MDTLTFFNTHKGWNGLIVICHTGHVRALKLNEFKKVEGIFSIGALDYSKQGDTVNQIGETK